MPERKNPTRVITARDVLRKTPGVINDSIIPGARFVIGKRKTRYEISPYINGKHEKASGVYTFTAANLKEAGEQLIEGRQAVRKVLEDARRGIGPKKRKEIEEQEAAKAALNTVEAVGEHEWQVRGRHLSQADERRRLLDDLIKRFGPLPIADLTRYDITSWYYPKGEEARYSANRRLQLLRRICEHAKNEGLIDRNPCEGIDLFPESPRERTATDEEIRTLETRLAETMIHPAIQRIIRVILRTLQRRTEVVELKWSEIDLQRRLWVLPSSRTKSSRRHIVPLVGSVWDLLGEPDDHDHVFHDGAGRPFAPRYVSRAMQRAVKALGIEERLHLHDLRRSGATMMAEHLRIAPHVIGAILNHQPGGVTMRHYAQAEYFDEKTSALRAWDARIREIVSGQPMPEKVTQLRA